MRNLLKYDSQKKHVFVLRVLKMTFRLVHTRCHFSNNFADNCFKNILALLTIAMRSLLKYDYQEKSIFPKSFKHDILVGAHKMASLSIFK